MASPDQKSMLPPPPPAEGEAAKIEKPVEKPEIPEAKRVYENIGEDPTYRDIQDDITRRTNSDSQVETARRDGKNFSDTWNRVAIREDMNGMDRFAANYPEKTQAYANRWKEFAVQNPEVEQMNNSQWEKWCDTHPGMMLEMNEPRRVARAVSRSERRSEESQQRQTVKEAERTVQIKSEGLGLPVSDEEKQMVEGERKKLTGSQTRRISENMKMSSSDLAGSDAAELSRKQEDLKDLPFIASKDVKYLTDFEGDDDGFEFVETDRIVGTVSGAFENWSTEYESRKGRTAEIAKGLLQPNEQTTEDIFHPRKENERIKLKKVTGPSGPLYIAVDGSHRVAGCKLAQAREIPAQVENVSNLKEIRTEDETLAGQWERRIEKGLIEGEVKKTETGGFQLEIKSQILPWMHLPDTEMIKFSQLYESQYAGAFDKLKIPKQALLDIVAYNHFMAGRWEEYERMQGGGK